MKNSTIQRISFGILLIAVTAAFIWLIRGFLQPIFWAIALGIIFVPVHAKILALVKNRESVAAGLTLIVVLLLAIFPLVGIISAVASEGAVLYERVHSGEINISGSLDWLALQMPAIASSLESVGVEPDKLKSQLSSIALQASQFMTAAIMKAGQNTVRVAVMFFLMLYLLFFVVRDGSRMLAAVVHAVPLGDERERALLNRFAEVSRATIKGTLVIGVVQGTIGGITFAVLGVGSPVLWGVVMSLLSIVPAVGPAFVWVPAAIMLAASGQVWAAVTLVFIGVIVIGLADNLLRPLLVGRDTKMPDYLILLSTLGGLFAFGLAGVVIGPIIAAFFLTVWEMAVIEYGDHD